MNPYLIDLKESFSYSTVRALSKKQLDHLRTAFGLLAGSLLLCFPTGFSFGPQTHLQTALITAVLSLGLSHAFLQLGNLPSVLRLGVFFPVACSATFTLLALPHSFMVLWLLLPFGILLLSQRQRFLQLPRTLFLTVIFLTLFCGSLRLNDLLTSLPHQGLPRLPSHRFIWAGILLVIPLGFATRKKLHPFAKALFRYEILIFSILLGSYALIWTAATAFKLKGEPALSFHELAPQPRFFLLPKLPGRLQATARVGVNDEIYPSELRKEPHRTDLLRTLDEMTWRLHDVYLRTTFPEDGQISGEEKVRAMKVYGFLLEDRHGPFLPAASLNRPAPPEMDESYLGSFRESMDQIVLSPFELATILEVPPDQAKVYFLTLKKFNWVQRVSGSEERYRLTSQARHPFENKLRPRQLLVLEQADESDSIEIDQSEYGKKRQLTLRETRWELKQLVDNLAAETKRVWQLNQHVDFLMNPNLWQKIVPLVIGLLLALLAGRCLPDDLAPSRIWALGFIGLLLYVPLPLQPGLQAALRITSGLWISRNLLSLGAEDCNRLSLFASVPFISASIMASLPPDTVLIHQALWVVLWTLPAILLVGCAFRKAERGLSGTRT